MRSNVIEATQTSDFASASSKEFLDIQATTECGLTLKYVYDMTRTYSLFYKAYKKLIFIILFLYIEMTTNCYKKHKENPRKEARKRCKNLSEKGKEKK